MVYLARMIRRSGLAIASKAAAQATSVLVEDGGSPLEL